MSIHNKLNREDALEILALAEAMHHEAPSFQNKPFDKHRMWAILDSTLHNPHNVCMIYAKIDGKIVGGILGKISEQFFSGERVASDYGMFILPEYRGSLTFVKMFKAFEDWAVENKAKTIIVGHTTGIETEKAKSLFPRLGYSLMGYIFNKEIPNV